MMPSVKGQKEGAVIMENGLAEMRAQRPVQGLVIKSGGPPRDGSRNTKNEDLTPEPRRRGMSISPPQRRWLTLDIAESVRLFFFGERYC